LRDAIFRPIQIESRTDNSGDSNTYRYTGMGNYHVSTGVNAFRVLFSSGNIASGIVRVYGVAH
jgi:hypothetical protein